MATPLPHRAVPPGSQDVVVCRAFPHTRSTALPPPGSNSSEDDWWWQPPGALLFAPRNPNLRLLKRKRDEDGTAPGVPVSSWYSPEMHDSGDWVCIGCAWDGLPFPEQSRKYPLQMSSFAMVVDSTITIPVAREDLESLNPFDKLMVTGSHVDGLGTFGNFCYPKIGKYQPSTVSKEQVVVGPALGIDTDEWFNKSRQPLPLDESYPAHGEEFSMNTWPATFWKDVAFSLKTGADPVSQGIPYRDLPFRVLTLSQQAEAFHRMMGQRCVQGLAKVLQVDPAVFVTSGNAYYTGLSTMNDVYDLALGYPEQRDLIRTFYSNMRIEDNRVMRGVDGTVLPEDGESPAAIGRFYITEGWVKRLFTRADHSTEVSSGKITTADIGPVGAESFRSKFEFYCGIDGYPESWAAALFIDVQSAAVYSSQASGSWTPGSEADQNLRLDMGYDAESLGRLGEVASLSRYRIEDVLPIIATAYRETKQSDSDTPSWFLSQSTGLFLTRLFTWYRENAYTVKEKAFFMEASERSTSCFGLLLEKGVYSARVLLLPNSVDNI